MKSFLMVFLGGGLGSSLRFLISRHLNLPSHIIPWGTLSVNILGSMLLGFILGFIVKSTSLSGNTILFLATGFCGGFTTFSAFAVENVEYLKSGDYFNLAIYSLGSLILGFAAVIAGFYCSKFL